ncbi:uncharacterized protein LOC123716264 [Pieris brassicae]|uniref:Uncharacterized protein n=1 Tax=Pieris brassicae TaxID=7116 RepID=A0A9P0XBX2_PIEBR|nr:uncharacterized protein LOC123716264 [Pieris brassicae]CAH4029124.1 unnamed protein product [Pieris brassicae]
MKFFIAFAALTALAVAVPVQKPINQDEAHLQAIIDAINSPHTDPATAALLEQQLESILGELKPIIDPSPALVDEAENINIGPALLDENEPISTDPALVEGNVPVSAPLVQVIINVNAKPAKPALKPEEIDNSPAIVPESPIIPDPINIGEPELPLKPDPINIGVPILPDLAINLPEELH